MKRLMNRLMGSCETASVLISLSQEQPLTTLEKIQLKIHLFICRGCGNFDHNTKALSEMMKSHKAHCEEHHH